MRRALAPSPSPSWAPSYTTTVIQKEASPPQSSGRLPLSFSPTLIAMVAAVAAAFLLITYSRPLSRHLILLLRRWRHRRRRQRYLLPSSSTTTFSHLDSSPSPPPFPFDYSPDAFHVYSPNGLDDAVIKTIPLSIYYSSHKTTPNKNDAVSIKECAVCLLEFEEREYVRTLPVCSHAFHVDCIDIWLRSHANCPLCRARIFPPDSPFVTVMSSRIRPSFHDVIYSVTSPIQRNASLATTTSTTTTTTGVTEITPFIEEPSPRRIGLNVNEEFEVNNNNNDNNSSNSNGYRLLKRSYSFGFERSGFLDTSERMLETEPATASPWRLRRRSFWSKRPLTPFKSRVFSFRNNYRGGGGGIIMKSPAFFRRRFPSSERFSNAGGSGVGGSSSSRRSRYVPSPMFHRSTAAAGGVFCSSRLRCGDPEALLSPERLNGRR